MRTKKIETKRIYFLVYFLLLGFLGNLHVNAQYYYSQWASNIVSGTNTFNINSGTSNTNWTSGIQAITPELLANSVTVLDSSGNVVSLSVKKNTKTSFQIVSSVNITGATVTAQWPGATVSCNAPTLVSAVRGNTSSSNTTVTYTWTFNGTNFGTVGFEYSTDNGLTWNLGGQGSPTSPRTYTVPCGNNILTRIRAYSSDCPSGNIVSNSLTLTNCDTTPSSYTGYGVQAVGNYFASGDPKNIGCGNICVTFSTTNWGVYLNSSITDPSNTNLVGVQLYLKKPDGTYVPANITNCADSTINTYATSNTCNRTDTGVRWIRWPGATPIYIVDSNGKITGQWGTCP